MRYVYIIIHTAKHVDYGNMDFNFKEHSEICSSLDVARHNMEWRYNYERENGMEVTSIEFADNPSPYLTAELCSFTAIDKYGFTTKHQLFRSPI